MCAARAILEYAGQPGWKRRWDFPLALRRKPSEARRTQDDAHTATVLVSMTRPIFANCSADPAAHGAGSGIEGAWPRRTRAWRQQFDLCLPHAAADGEEVWNWSLTWRALQRRSVAVITAYGSAETRGGAEAGVRRPVETVSLEDLARWSSLRSAARNALRREACALQLLGDSPPMRQAREMIYKLARSQAPF